MTDSALSTWPRTGLTKSVRIAVNTGTSHGYIDLDAIVSAVNIQTLLGKKRSFTKTGTWNAIEYVPSSSKYVIGRDDTTSRLSTSTDLVNFTDLAITSIACKRSAYGNGVVVFAMNLSTTGAFRYSSDGGATWGTVTLGDAHTVRDIKFIPELSLFVAVTSAGSGRVLTSPDGATWTARASAPAGTWYGVAYDSTLDRLLIIGRTGAGRVAHTTDFVNFATWTSVSVSATYQLNYTSIAYSEDINQLQAVCTNKATVANVISNDGGATWSAGGLDPAFAWNEILYVPPLRAWFALAYEGAVAGSVLGYSVDGVLWDYNNYTEKYKNIKWNTQLSELLMVGEANPEIIKFIY